MEKETYNISATYREGEQTVRFNYWTGEAFPDGGPGFEMITQLEKPLGVTTEAEAIEGIAYAAGRWAQDLRKLDDGPQPEKQSA